MKYFLDQEFHEYSVKHSEGWFNKSRNVHIIDLISIALVGENGREYYAISNDFDIKAAWNNEWLRDNVLKSIFDDAYIDVFGTVMPPFCLSAFKYVVNKIGKTNEQIAGEVKEFCKPTRNFSHTGITVNYDELKYHEFYGYYADYDWVLFCSLFGTMMQLPKGFPMYCIDLKQMIDAKCDSINKEVQLTSPGTPLVTHKSMKENNPFYPKQTNEHNALEDAKWNMELYKFLQSIK